MLLRLSNEADGTSRATFVSIDEGGLEMPSAIAQQGSRVTIDVKVTGGRYAGALNAAATELSGTYTVQGLELPLTLTRTVAN